MQLLHWAAHSLYASTAVTDKSWGGGGGGGVTLQLSQQG